MVEEVLRLLDPVCGGVHIDLTAGGGGHALAVGRRLEPGGSLVMFDRDAEALTVARERVAGLNLRIEAVQANFSDVESQLDALGIGQPDTMLLDLGVSSHQLDSAERGFSFRLDGPLDMRLDASSGETAAQMLARLDALEIERILREHGDERWARRISSAIVRARSSAPICTTLQLADIVRSAVPRSIHDHRIHPATRTFMALRIALNGEMEALEAGLAACIRRLAPGGRIAVLSWQSNEDRRVKREFARLSGICQCEPGLPDCRCGARVDLERLVRKPLEPTPAEISANLRARSAKLRGARKLP